MSFLVDTDICSAHLKNGASVTGRFLQYTGRLYLSVISLGELYAYAFRRSTSPRVIEGLLRLLSDVTLLDVDREVARKFGEIRAEMLDRGRPVAGLDLMIAATAVAHDLTLVTHNRRDFIDVPGLTVVDWMEA